MKVPEKVKNTNIFDRAAGFSRPRLRERILVSMITLALSFATWPQNLAAYQDAQGSAQSPGYQPQQAQSYAQQTPEQLQQLVAPIALYPDSLVAQILAASTFPSQVVEADRWVQANPDLKGDALAQVVDQQSWDPSVKALTAFSSVLANMDKNISWTSSLGDSYYNQQQDVMDAIQVMRQRAQEGGNLKSTPQQTVELQGSTIVIQPAEPQIVYVPAYDPWLVYGGPIVAWPGWYPYPGIWYGGPYVSFGVGCGIGYFGGYGWGWSHWGSDWHNRVVVYNHNAYYSRSTTFYNRNNYYRGGGERGVASNVHGGVYGNRGGYTVYPGEANKTVHGDTHASGGVYNRPGATIRPFNGNTQAARGYTEPRGQSGVQSGAFSGYSHGGEARSDSSRGSTSFGGGGSHGGEGGGGSHGGGHR